MSNGSPSGGLYLTSTSPSDAVWVLTVNLANVTGVENAGGNKANGKTYRGSVDTAHDTRQSLRSPNSHEGLFLIGQ